jgi:proliferating cell nuclear antigen
MSTDAAAQGRLIDPADDAVATIETEGRVIRPALAMIAAADIQEVRLHVHEDGLTVNAVDPANVAMIELDIHAEAFDSFDADGGVIGLALDDLRSQLRSARKGKRTSDPVTLNLDDRRIKVLTERDYGGSTVRAVGEELTIDPDSIRDDPDIPDLDLAWRAATSPKAIQAAVGHCDGVEDYLKITNRNEALHFEANGDVSDAVVEVEADVEPLEHADEDAASLFSTDYLDGMAGGLVDGLVDDVSVEFGTEFPCIINFERTDDGETLYEGQYLLAPRITDGGGA